jgi:tetratricopeptide (TPR) repeat protein
MLIKKNRIMNAKKVLIAAVMMMGLIVYGQENRQVGTDNTGISQSEMQRRVNSNVNTSLAEKRKEETAEAIQILKETQEVVSYLAQDKKDEAEKKLAGIIGKLEIMLVKHPEMALIPVSSNVEVHDVVVDIKAVDEIMKQVKEAIDKGYYQQAKGILNDLSSEMVIKTAYLPMGTYPDAMRLAAKLLGENRNKEAAAVLVNAMGTLVVKEDVIPLPVLRAEEYVKQALAVMSNEKTFKENKEVLTALLDAADYQLKLAEAMGYGKHDKEYKDLATAIKDLKSYVAKEREKKTRKALQALQDELKKFKERLFPVKNQK